MHNGNFNKNSYSNSSRSGHRVIVSLLFLSVSEVKVLDVALLHNFHAKCRCSWSVIQPLCRAISRLACIFSSVNVLFIPRELIKVIQSSPTSSDTHQWTWNVMLTPELRQTKFVNVHVPARTHVMPTINLCIKT